MASHADTAFFGHPAGLSTCFFTEMWERFSYYGMRAILILFMTAPVASGGLGFDDATAAAVYGIYVSSVYLLNLPGGWLADRFLGQQRSVILGGMLIAAGQGLLAVPNLTAFYSGLAVIAFGTGLLKVNVSTLVGQLYSDQDKRRDAGFTIYYLGINLGAFLAPLIVGYIGQQINWRWGFAAAGVGMVAGVVQFILGIGKLRGAGKDPVPPRTPEESGTQRRLLAGFVGLLIVTAVVTVASGVSAATFADILGIVLAFIFFGVFAYLLSTGDWTPTERNRIIVIGVLVLAATVFWSSFEQAGSTLNLFADRNTDNRVFGFAYPSSWFQSLNSAYLFVLGPLFAALWIRLGPRDPAPPVKFPFGLIFVGLGFWWLALGAAQSAGGALVSPIWLAGTYLLHTVGELLLSPVGLSTVTKLAPARVASLMMGVFFLSNAMGNYLGGRLGAVYQSLPLTTLFGTVGACGVLAGILLLLFAKPITRLMGGVR